MPQSSAMNSSGTVHKIYKLDCRRWKYLTFIFLFDVTCVVDSHPTVTDLIKLLLNRDGNTARIFARSLSSSPNWR